jgi:hypothetical protein
LSKNVEGCEAFVWTNHHKQQRQEQNHKTNHRKSERTGPFVSQKEFWCEFFQPTATAERVGAAEAQRLRERSDEGAENSQKTKSPGVLK